MSTIIPAQPGYYVVGGDCHIHTPKLEHDILYTAPYEPIIAWEVLPSGNLLPLWLGCCVERDTEHLLIMWNGAECEDTALWSIDRVTGARAARGWARPVSRLWARLSRVWGTGVND